MRERKPQPPVNPARRDLERHDFWPGFIATLVGVLLLVCGARHLTGVETVDGGTAWETQLIKAYANGGLKYPEAAPPPPRPQEDPVATAEALERWARQTVNATPPTWKVRVDTTAQTPCPT